jgi:DNA-binding NtrC family response regulator
VNLKIPPLRDRPADVLELAQHFVRRYSQANGMPLRPLSADARRALVVNRWPGNVRELENTIERAVVLCTGDRITPELLPDYLRYPARTDQPALIVPADGISLKDAVSNYERTMILQSLELANGVQKRAAELLQLKPSTLNEMMKRLGIHAKSNAVVEDEVAVND